MYISLRLSIPRPEDLAIYDFAVWDLFCTLGIELHHVPGAHLHVIIKPGAGKGLAGYHEQGHGWHTIAVDSGQSTGRTYLVLLHELGHYLGLEHTPGGIMAEAIGNAKLTLNRRREWCSRFGYELAKMNFDKHNRKMLSVVDGRSKPCKTR